MARHEYFKEDVEQRFQATVGKRLGDIDCAGVFEAAKSGENKGIAGNVFEQSVLGYPPDSDKEPDLILDGEEWELKVTGIVKNRSGWRAKEPMSITAVSPDAIVDEEFPYSAFWHKADKLLVVYYLYNYPEKGEKADYSTFEVKGFDFHTWSEEDIDRLEADWTIVRDYVRGAPDKATAPEEEYSYYMANLSTLINPKLMYLNTAPKYPHPPRFRLKNSVVTAMAKERLGEHMEQIGVGIDTMDDFDRTLHRFADAHRSKKVSELAEEFDLEIGEGGAKALSAALLVRAFGATGRIGNIEFFEKAGIKLMSVVLTRKGGRTEDMKLNPSIDFEALLDPDAEFEDSEFYEHFAESTAVVAVFEEPSHEAPLGENVFLGFKRLWLGEFLEQAEAVWREMRRLVFGGELRDVPQLRKDGTPKVTPKTGIASTAPNWPKKLGNDGKRNDVFIRGTGSDARNKVVEINGVAMYRQNIWLSGQTVADRLAGMEFI